MYYMYYYWQTDELNITVYKNIIKKIGIVIVR